MASKAQTSNSDGTSTNIPTCSSQEALGRTKKKGGMAGSSSNNSKGIVAVVGVGAKLGRSIARKFAHEGYTVAILARDLVRLSRFADEIARDEKAQVFAIRIDCSDGRSVREAFEGVHSLGFVEVLVYNASSSSSSQHTSNTTASSSPNNHNKFTDIATLTSLEKSLSVSAVGAFHCSQQVIPGMVDRGKGTILFTGCSASLRGISGFYELTCGKFALRGLSQCLAREFEPLGIHVAHIIIDGVIGPSRSSQRSGTDFQQQQQSGEALMDPDAVAQTYWHIHVQDKSAWTHEIDLRSRN